jgi:hypothetical protein
MTKIIDANLVDYPNDDEEINDNLESGFSANLQNICG